jgi:DNA polymerase-3 subunit gamma/tau
MAEDTQQQEFLVTARKWRPQRFSDVVGQEHITRTLANAISKKRLHHAYLFTGPRGVGKTTCARILARAVNCLNPSNSEPCNVCASCTDMLSGRSVDIIEIDGASNNSVDDVRKLRDNVKYAPLNGAYKMYIIDEVHMLSTSAFNALLKTLEEPPPHLVFVFATTEIHKVPATILSRCQRFDFRRMEIDTIVQQLRSIAVAEGITIDEESLVAVARKADGSMRDSQSIFDQVVSFCGTTIAFSELASVLHLIDVDFYFALSDAIRGKDVAAMFNHAREVVRRGYDLQECLVGLLEHYRNILTVITTGGTSLIEASAAHASRYAAEAAACTQADVLRIMTLVSQGEAVLRSNPPQPRIRFEFTLVQLASMDSTVDLGKVLATLAKATSDGSMRATAPTAPRMVPQAIRTATATKVPVLQANALSAGNLAARWSDAVEAMPDTLAAFKGAVRQAGLVHVDFTDVGITVTPMADVLFQRISDRADALRSYLQTFYGTSVAVRIMPPQAPAKSTADTASTANTVTHDEPITETERLLIDLFKARHISTPGTGAS